MATQADIDKNAGVTDRRFTQGNAATDLAAPLTYTTLTTLDAALTAADGTTYSAANLLKLTKNDKVYALRLASDSAGL